MHLLKMLWRCITAVRCIKKRHAPRCIHKMQKNFPVMQKLLYRQQNEQSTPALREISGTYWLTWVSLATVSRRPRIIRSIDPTVANFQVNDPDLWEICGDENHNLPFSLLLNLLYYTIEKCRFESILWHCFFMKICLIFYSYYIVTRGYIYTTFAMYILV